MTAPQPIDIKRFRASYEECNDISYEVKVYESTYSKTFATFVMDQNSLVRMLRTGNYTPTRLSRVIYSKLA